ncbi:MAG: cytochrome c peroxidase, partial [Ardenticatenaceae bacterium]
MRRLNWKWILVVLLATPFVLCAVLGLLPAPSDPLLSPEEIVVGARGQEENDGAVEGDFPPVKVPIDNSGTPEKEELGYLLFFDPVLSANNDISCATCHHPDL